MTVVLLLLVLGACDDVAGPKNRVDAGSSDAPSWFVDVTATGFVPECKAISVGDTVEWTNTSPEIPANVTSLTEPAELYSPNLQGDYVTWTHTFEAAGHFDYYDTNSGDPGRKIVDAYYGTVTYVGTSETTNIGAICVRESTSPLGQCCCSDLDCSAGQQCAVNVCTETD